MMSGIYKNTKGRAGLCVHTRQSRQNNTTSSATLYLISIGLYLNSN